MDTITVAGITMSESAANYIAYEMGGHGPDEVFGAMCAIGMVSQAHAYRSAIVELRHLSKDDANGRQLAEAHDRFDEAYAPIGSLIVLIKAKLESFDRIDCI
jgi:hypothetical protein